jgi:hypothetical protein
VKAKKVRGVVVEIKPASCIVITPDGGFEEVRRPGGNIRLGDEIESGAISRLQRFQSLLKPLVAAAIIFIAVFAGYGYSGRFQPQSVAYAYVSLDINPSIEIGVDRDNRIVTTRGLNRDGEKLLRKLSLKSQDLYRGISVIVGEAINQGYIKADQDNFVLSTLSCGSGEKSDGGITDNRLAGQREKIEEAIEEPVAAKGMATMVAVEEVKPEFRKKALTEGISPGKMLLRERAGEKKIQVEIDELKVNSINSLEKNKHIRLEQMFPGVKGKRADENVGGKKAAWPVQRVPADDFKHQQGQGTKKQDKERGLPGRPTEENDKNKTDKKSPVKSDQYDKRKGNGKSDQDGKGSSKKGHENGKTAGKQPGRGQPGNSERD